MDQATAWKLASEIVDLIGIESVSMRTQEQIADLLRERDGFVFNEWTQSWKEEKQDDEAND